LAPFGSLYGETDYYNYDIGNNLDPLVDSKDREIKECQTVYNNNNNGSNSNSSEKPKTFIVKQEKSSLGPGENAFQRFKFEKAESKKKGEVVEKKKRGRPRLNTGQGPLNPMYVDLDGVNLSARALTERPSDLYNAENEALVTIGSYSKAIRRGKIERFKAKKVHALQYGPHLRFAFRKQFAGARPRVGGRFIKLHSDPFLGTPPPMGVDSDSDMMLSKDELLEEEGNSSVHEGEFFFPLESERDAMNLSASPPHANDPFYNDLVNQYAALFTGRPNPHFAPFPFNVNLPIPGRG